MYDDFDFPDYLDSYIGNTASDDYYEGLYGETPTFGPEDYVVYYGGSGASAQPDFTSQNYPDSYTGNTASDVYYGVPTYGGLQYASQADQIDPDSLWGKMNQYGKVLESPGGKLATGIGGGLISAFGAYRQNALNKAAYKKQQQMLAERQARAMKYDSPLYFSNGRTNSAPQQRGGESVWYANNSLSANKPTSDKGIFAAAEGGRTPPNEDATSALGFIKYLMAGRKLPSEQRAEGVERAIRTGVPNEYMTREEYLKMLEDQIVNGSVARASGGPNYVKGGALGQADTIPARLSDGEYVIDADVVSALGDGNNEAGAAKLDQMRQGIRAHKRAAPTNKIPPKAKSPLAYMKSKGVR